MSKLQPVIDFLRAHWGAITPILIGIAANLYNGLSPYTQNWFSQFVDLLCVVTKKDSPGTYKLPVAMKSTPPGSKHRGWAWKKAVAVLLPVMFLTTLSSCYCWQTAHQNEPKCVVAHQVVNCAKAAAAGEIAPLIPIVAPILSGQAPNWMDLLASLEKTAGDAVICAIQQIIGDYAKASPSSPPDPKVTNARAYLAKYHPGMK